VTSNITLNILTYIAEEIIFYYNVGQSDERDVYRTVAYLALSKCRIGVFSDTLDFPKRSVSCHQTQSVPY